MTRHVGYGVTCDGCGVRREIASATTPARDDPTAAGWHLVRDWTAEGPRERDYCPRCMGGER